MYILSIQTVLIFNDIFLEKKAKSNQRFYYTKIANFFLSSVGDRMSFENRKQGPNVQWGKCSFQPPLHQKKSVFRMLFST